MEKAYTGTYYHGEYSSSRHQGDVRELSMTQLVTRKNMHVFVFACASIGIAVVVNNSQGSSGGSAGKVQKNSVDGDSFVDSPSTNSPTSSPDLTTIEVISHDNDSSSLGVTESPTDEPTTSPADVTTKLPAVKPT
eukprot:3989889-Ditylum_brightwellii.AAC.1